MASPSAPSFIKPFLLPSESHLPLRTDFVTKYLGNKIPEDAIITTSNGGYLWKLKIIKIGDDYCFTHGWSNVVEEIKLGFGDVLYFSLVDKSTFELSIYSPNGFQKVLPPKVKVAHDAVSVDVSADVDDGCTIDDDVIDDDDADDDVIDYDDDADADFKDEDYENEKEDEEDDGSYDDDDDDDNDDGDDSDPFFISTVSKAHKSTLNDDNDDDEDDDDDDDEDKDDNDNNDDEDEVDGGGKINGEDGDPVFTVAISRLKVMRLPEEIGRLPGMQEGKTMTVRNLKGEEQQLKLWLDKSYKKKKRYALSTGWYGFKKDNNLMYGDECVFKYIKSQGKLCLIKVIKEKFTSKELVCVNMETEDEIDIDGEDDNAGHPSAKFILTNKRHWRIPEKFMRLRGIEAGKSITVKGINGKKFPLHLFSKTIKSTAYKKKRYYASGGWRKFMTSNKLSVGDECVVKYIRSQGIFHLTKIVKNKRPPGKMLVAKALKRRKRTYEHDSGAEVAVVKRPPGRPPKRRLS